MTCSLCSVPDPMAIKGRGSPSRRAVLTVPVLKPGPELAEQTAPAVLGGVPGQT